MTRGAVGHVFHRTMIELEQALTCDLISSPIDLELGVKRWSAPDEEVFTYALRNRYSRVALRASQEGQGEDIIGVAVVNLRDRRIERQEIHVGAVIDAATPLSAALELVVARRYLFVRKGQQIEKILTVSDLNKLPVRVYIATLLLHFESLLADLIAASVEETEWLTVLDEKRREEVLRLQREKVWNEIDSRLIDCTTLKDKIRIAGNSQSCRRILASSPREFSAIRADRTRQLRNSVIHPSGFASWKAVRRVSDGVRDVQAWIRCLDGDLGERDLGVVSS